MPWARVFYVEDDSLLQRSWHEIECPVHGLMYRREADAADLLAREHDYCWDLAPDRGRAVLRLMLDLLCYDLRRIHCWRVGKHIESERTDPKCCLWCGKTWI